MRQAVPVQFSSRSDFDIVRGIADALGLEPAFSEGLDELGWVRRMYEEVRADAAGRAVASLPEFDEFWSRGHLEVPVRGGIVFLEKFRADPAAHPLATESGRIVLSSRLLAERAYPDCPPRPTFLAKEDMLGAERARRYPFHLLSAQPGTRLHSQLDFGRVSRDGKVAGREPMLVNPDDARRLGLADGDTALLENDRGRCLAGVRLSADVRPSVAVLPTGAWFAPFESGEGMLDIAGNPNVLTADVPASAFSQGCAAHTCLVAISRYEGNAPLPDLTAPAVAEAAE